MLNIVVFGGGSGLSTIETLKDQANVTAVVPATDRGGSSGELMKDGLTELPAGDAAKAIGYLSEMSAVLYQDHCPNKNIAQITIGLSGLLSTQTKLVVY